MGTGPGPQHGRTVLRLQYGEQELNASSGQRLLDAILAGGIDHRHICGGRGFCTSCRVEVVGSSNGLSQVSALERARLGNDAGRLRLACQARVRGRVHVRVPAPAVSRFSPYADDRPSSGDDPAR